MGSKFFDLHLADPQRVHELVRGDHPEVLRAYRERPEPADEKLAPAFEVMARGTFCFLPRGREHPDGAMYGRAVEFILQDVGTARWGIECYPDESEYTLWQLIFGPCDADWLTVPASPSGVPDLRYRSARTCSDMRNWFSGQLASGKHNPDYLPEHSLKEIVEALDEGRRSEHGLFVIYQA